jgi:hypothetical protein
MVLDGLRESRQRRGDGADVTFREFGRGRQIAAEKERP